MNPFDLPGPQFLLFYVGLAVATILVLRILRQREEAEPAGQARAIHELKAGLGRLQEPGGAPKVSLSDPYLIAYLRGGKNEVVRVASVSLIDRRLLEVKAERALKARPLGEDLVSRPIEKALLQHFRAEQDATTAFADARLAQVAETYERTLAELKLIPDATMRAARRRRLTIAVAVLVGVAALKILIALSRGRTNIGFLVILTALAVFVAAKVGQSVRTAHGTALLADLRTLFGSLRDRALVLRPGGGTSELALLAAVFGLAAVPAATFPFVPALYPRVTREGSGSSCGSSCGSSSGGSSCGSSCGGGGGGGCGGCGGGGD
jgi:uncharacterized protein (TIGR04222 family)